MNLNVSTLFFELALIFIPGFIWMKIHSRYGLRGDKTQFDLILNAFIFGVLSYGLLYVTFRYNGWPLKIFELDADSRKLIQPEIFPEILAAVVISVVGGVISKTTSSSPVLSRQLEPPRRTVTKTCGISFSIHLRARQCLFISETSSRR